MEPTVASLSEDRAGALTAARDAIAAGQCIVLPTDTVYGIGADAFNAKAVASLLAAKNRGRNMPPPVLIAEPAVLMTLGRDVSDHAKALASELWPGALTVIVAAQPSLNLDLGDTRGTIAIRVPNHADARDLLRRTGPMAVSSANRSGMPAARTIDEAQLELADQVAVYLDGGACDKNEPSTIVDFTTSDYGVVVRHGAIPIERLREIVPFLEDGVPVVEPEPELSASQESEPEKSESQESEPQKTETEEPASDEEAAQESGTGA